MMNNINSWGFFSELAQILAQHHLTQAVLSPGSRVAPITLALARHPDIHTHIQIDERSAGYTALGMATCYLQKYQQKHAQKNQNNTENPPFVLIACTSGTAVLNYSPAIAEAFYQNIPLLVLTADRPPEWIDQKDGQAIRQNHVFANFVKKSFTLPADMQHPDAYQHATRLVNEAILALKTPPFQPIHINIPIREPFYPKANTEIDFSKKIHIIQQFLPKNELKNEDWQAFRQIWDNADRRLMLAGQGFYDGLLQKYVSEIAHETNTPLVVDILGNFPAKNAFFVKNFDVFGGKLGENEAKNLVPDLLITWGEGTLSKQMRGFFRKNKPKYHIHIQEAGEVSDTFQSITHIIRTNPIYFFEKLVLELDFDAFLHKDLSDNTPEAEEYATLWQKYDQQAERYLYNFIQQAENQTKFYELAIVEHILSQIPANTNLHLANSMSVRYANYWANTPNLQNEVHIYSNRGTSGIDGCTSTALGMALADKNRLNVLITGDLAFFYDRNAFFRKEIPTNLGIILLNNQGGNIFRFVEGANIQPELVDFFETPHHFTAQRTAEDSNMDYFGVKDNISLKKTLDILFSQNEPPKKAWIVEVFTDRETNTEVLGAMKRGFLW